MAESARRRPLRPSHHAPDGIPPGRAVHERASGARATAGPCGARAIAAHSAPSGRTSPAERAGDDRRVPPPLLAELPGRRSRLSPRSRPRRISAGRSCAERRPARRGAHATAARMDGLEYKTDAIGAVPPRAGARMSCSAAVRAAVAESTGRPPCASATCAPSHRQPWSKARRAAIAPGGSERGRVGEIRASRFEPPPTRTSALPHCPARDGSCP